MKLHALTGLFLMFCFSALASAATVTARRTPDEGVQPQVVVDEKGTIHLIYFKGKHDAGDLFYIRSNDQGKNFSKAIQVNSQPATVLITGVVRGPHLAIGRNGRAHITWFGSQSTRAAGHTPLLYARLNDDGSAFEPQRDVIQEKHGLDGGCSVSADNAGNVYVSWHAPEKAGGKEDNRRIWLSVSKDDGKSFAKEVAASPEPTGACGCCGMRMFTSAGGATYISYRSALEQVNRDIYLLASTGPGEKFTSTRVGPWTVGICVMSTSCFVPHGDGALMGYEQEKQVYYVPVSPDGKAGKPVAAPGAGSRKYPALATNAQGQVLMAWSEGSTWGKGGIVQWQLFDADGNPVGPIGRGQRLAPWGVPAVFATDEGFVVLY